MASNLAYKPHDAPGHFAPNVLQSAFDFACVGLAVCGRDGRMLFVNDCPCGILGFARAELTDQHWTRYIHIAGGDCGPEVMPGRRVRAFGPRETRLQGRDGHLAKELGIAGCTVFSGVESFGADGRRHSARFFELSDQPMEVVMAVTEEQGDRCSRESRWSQRRTPW